MAPCLLLSENGHFLRRILLLCGSFILLLHICQRYYVHIDQGYIVIFFQTTRHDIDIPNTPQHECALQVLITSPCLFMVYSCYTLWIYKPRTWLINTWMLIGFFVILFWGKGHFEIHCNKVVLLSVVVKVNEEKDASLNKENTLNIFNQQG